ncbi:MAG: thermosome subunit alpha [Candidatus Nanoarchaeia archaeon]|nr:thermosome subunit alpha [Candidatus Nanoarchaeia archaeon]MDD5740739.1 thermosome subunit alpha [Candidatus Nanoarchaeia archaeon]
MPDKQPIYILPESVERTIGRDAQRNNILAAKLVSDAVKTTLGPKGMDKMLVSSVGDITVTNDGVTILEEMEIEHPAAKMMVEIAKTQESEVGDGTTTAVMLAGKLLENAEKLLDMKIHPTVITKGYNLAAVKAKEFLNEVAVEVGLDKKDDLKAIAMTAMTGKGAESVKEKFAGIIVDAIAQIEDKGSVDLGNIKIEKNKSNGVEDTELIKGIVIDKERVSIDMPVKVMNARIALISESLEIKNLEGDAKISVSDPSQLQNFLDREEMILKQMVEKIRRSNANVIFCQKGIDDMVQYYLAKSRIYACRRVAKSDMENLARATGGKIVSNLNDLTESELGKAQIVEEIKQGDEAMTYIRGCENPKALTILVHGGSEHVIDEMERAIRDGLGDVSAVIKSKKIVAGAGAVEIEVARRLRKFANSLGGREQLAVQEFANALEFIPTTLAENAGLDPIDVLTELKSRHDNGEKNAGINIFTNKVEDSFRAGIIEPMKIKTQAISSATEVAVMILRIDDVLASKSGKPKNSGMPNMADYE